LTACCCSKGHACDVVLPAIRASAAAKVAGLPLQCHACCGCGCPVHRKCPPAPARDLAPCSQPGALRLAPAALLQHTPAAARTCVVADCCTPLHCCCCVASLLLWRPACCTGSCGHCRRRCCCAAAVAAAVAATADCNRCARACPRHPPPQ
jgi:hypothetical protein